MRSKRGRPTLTDAMKAVAASLREFGYPDVTHQMIREIYDAWLAGKRGEDLPHGIIGRFAESQISEHANLLAGLSS